MSIDNVQARSEDGRIEVGLFEGEECREIIPLRAPEAFELRDSLNDALREAGLLNRKAAASEQHAVELLEVAREVVCTRIETADPVRFYERMNTVAERAKRVVERVDRGAGLRLSAPEREALAARPWRGGSDGSVQATDKRESSVALAVNERGLEEIKQFLAQNHKKGGAHFTRARLLAWAGSAEFQVSQGNPPCIEIPLMTRSTVTRSSTGSVMPAWIGVGAHRRLHQGRLPSHRPAARIIHALRSSKRPREI